MSSARKATLPSYCCDSMIEPFRKAGIGIEFYPVNHHGELQVTLDAHSDADILLWCNYFGFRNRMPEMGEYLNGGGVIIEDITHSLFSERPYHNQSNYLVASIRKWEPVNCGGFCSKVGGYLHQASLPEPPQEFVDLKLSAMEMKAEYLRGEMRDGKDRFLRMFADSNRWLAENYSGLGIDPWSREYLNHVDVDSQRRTRRANASVLYEALEGKVEFLFPEDDMDCPLFVPVLIKHRDEVRKRLTENGIYCPVHWPRPKGCVSNLYERELSLVCDQRYNTKDMERIAFVLSDAVGKFE